MVALTLVSGEVGSSTRERLSARRASVLEKSVSPGSAGCPSAPIIRRSPGDGEW
jgi:hypothetical protein